MTPWVSAPVSARRRTGPPPEPHTRPWPSRVGRRSHDWPSRRNPSPAILRASARDLWGSRGRSPSSAPPGTREVWPRGVCCSRPKRVGSQPCGRPGSGRRTHRADGPRRQGPGRRDQPLRRRGGPGSPKPACGGRARKRARPTHGNLIATDAVMPAVDRAAVWPANRGDTLACPPPSEPRSTCCVLEADSAADWDGGSAGRPQFAGVGLDGA